MGGKKVVVVMNAPGPMITSTWDTEASAILVSWLNGQQNGRGVAMALYGETHEASGRLPFTFPRCTTAACTKADELDSVQFGNDIANKQDRVYSEKALIGYRWYHARGISVSYPFGFGLFAYGTAEMQYSKAAVRAQGSGVSVTCELRHSGPRAGHDVPQLYLSFPSSVPGDSNSKPEWVLKGFSKVLVRPNEAVTASFQLTERDLSFWDDAPGRSLWVCATGEFRVCVGANSRDAVNPQKGSCTSFVSPCSHEPQLLVMKNDVNMQVKAPAARLSLLLSVAGLVSVSMVVAGFSMLGRWLRRRAQQPIDRSAEPSRMLLRQSDGEDGRVE